MSTLKKLQVRPRLEVTFNFEATDGYVKTVTVKEGQLVKDVVYVQNGEEKTVSGLLEVIHFISKQGISHTEKCVHDDVSIFGKFISITTLIIDCSEKYECNVVAVPAIYIKDIGSVEDIITEAVSVNGVEYATFTDALTAAEDGDTLTLSSDFQSDDILILGDGKSITINLNGHKMYAPYIEDNYSYIIKGDVTFDGEGKVYHGGEFGFGVQHDKKLTINSGIFTSMGTYLIGSWGETIINGGSFFGKYCCVNGFDGNVVINGGNFIAEEADNDPDFGWTVISGNVTVTGGTFNFPVHERYCADGYIPKKNIDGTYTVEKVEEHV